MKTIRAFMLLLAASAASSAQLSAPTAGKMLRDMANGNLYWAEYYSASDVDRAYYLGRADGLWMAAQIIDGR